MTKTVLKIDGMMCSMCEAHINDSVRNNFKVKKVTSSHSKGITEILSESPLDFEALKEVIDKTGYKIISSDISEETKKKFRFFK